VPRVCSHPTLGRLFVAGVGATIRAQRGREERGASRGRTVSYKPARGGDRETLPDVHEAKFKGERRVLEDVAFAHLFG
jgi:hypothetical protein